MIDDNGTYLWYKCTKCGKQQMFAYRCFHCNKLYKHFKLLPLRPEQIGKNIIYVIKECELEVRDQTFKK